MGFNGSCLLLIIQKIVIRCIKNAWGLVKSITMGPRVFQSSLASLFSGIVPDPSWRPASPSYQLSAW
jgi:hypothetical protein